ncbi:MAG: BrnT family toxin [Gammaproteobacteria bacterium]
MHTIIAVEYEWDATKSPANIRKHGVDFADAAMAIRDDHALTRVDPDSNGEVRYISLGMDFLARVLLTVFIHRGEKIRIISSRRASRAECQLYMQR